jgi:hypothetical protein
MKLFTTFVLVNEDAGPDVTPDILSSIANAIDQALFAEFQKAWGRIYRCRAEDGHLAPDELPVHIQASSTIQGAAGYHDDEGIYVFRDGLPSLTEGAFALSVVISHEIFETAGDPAANRWADTGQGEEFALELCDAVEAHSYVRRVPSGSSSTSLEVSLSDFLLPSFFDPSGSAPYSFTGAASAPFATAPADGEDYQIVRSVVANEGQVTALRVTSIRGARSTGIAAIRPERRSAKSHPMSRTARRLIGSRHIHHAAPSAPITVADVKVAATVGVPPPVAHRSPFGPPRAPLPLHYPPGDPRARR